MSTVTKTNRQHWHALAAAKPIDSVFEYFGLQRCASRIGFGKPESFRSVKPWTGKDSEDQLTDETIKNGYVSKPKVSNTLGTAKPTLMPHMKNGDGLLNLSQLILLSFRERQRSCAVTNLSAFKPPPRVTLTDARKTAWFADLANDTIPLRRLSRSIPHGVRGKVLLEQCSIHRVPISRALWLAKCVGANELRAFKRKGVSNQVMAENELKWVQEWTSNILDFIRDAVHQARKDNLLHASHIVMCLFAEDMVHRHQFLDAILDNLQASELDVLPSWLSLAQAWHLDIVASYRHANIIITLLKNRLPRIQDLPCSISSRCLIGAVRYLLNRTIQLTPTLFTRNIKIGSKSLSDTEYMHSSSHRGRSYSFLSDIGAHTMSPNGLGNALLSSPGEAQIYHVLDAYTGVEDFDPLRRAIARQDDISILELIVRWATTCYRVRKGAACVAAGLIQSLLASFRDEDSNLLANLCMVAKDPKTSPNKFAALGIALAESGLLDLKAYLHQLIASGELYEQTDVDCHLTFLRTVPSNLLSKQAHDIRFHLLQTPPNIATDRSPCLENQQDLRDTLPTIWAKIQSDVSYKGPYFNSCQTGLNGTLDIETLMNASTLWNATDQVVKLSSLDEAASLCNLLDRSVGPLKYFDVLAPIIRTASEDVLAIFTDFVGAYETALAIHGLWRDIRDLLIGRYRALRLVRGPSREVLRAFCRLRIKEPWQERYIAFETRASEHAQGVAAVTPASDVMTGNDSGTQTNEDLCSKLTEHDHPPMPMPDHVELFLKNTDRRVSPVTLIAATDYLANCIANWTAIRHAPLLLKLLCWVLQHTQGASEAFRHRLDQICQGEAMRAVVVGAIVLDEDSVASLFLDLSKRVPFHACPRALTQVAHNLLRPVCDDSDDKATWVDAVGVPEVDRQALCDTIDKALMNTDALSSGVVSIALGILTHLALHDKPEAIPALHAKLKQKLEQSLSRGNKHWAHITSRFPERLAVVCDIREQTEDSILALIEDSAAEAEEPKADAECERLLDIVKEASTRTPLCKTTSAIAFRTMKCLRTLRALGPKMRTTPLKAILSLCILHGSNFETDADLQQLLLVLCELLSNPLVASSEHICDLVFATAAHFIDQTSQDVIDSVAARLSASTRDNEVVRFFLDIRDSPYAHIYLRTTAATNTAQKDSSAISTLAAFNLTSDDPTAPPHILQPFEVKRWDLLPDASNKEGDNDTPLGLRFFDTRKVS
ncbi:MAG: hypothetical protein Q9162_003872 [Coniocarpon cinnabarinum]